MSINSLAFITLQRPPVNSRLKITDRSSRTMLRLSGTAYLETFAILYLRRHLPIYQLLALSPPQFHSLHHSAHGPVGSLVYSTWLYSFFISLLLSQAARQCLAVLMASAAVVLNFNPSPKAQFYINRFDIWRE